MGIYDRDYYTAREPGVHARIPQTAVMRILIATLAVYVAQLLFPIVTPALSLPDDWFLRPWRIVNLVTYGFAHSPVDLWHIALNMWGLWFFGRAVEERNGTREFMTYYLVAMVFSGLLWSITEYAVLGPATVIGASGACTAVFVLFAIYYPHQTVLAMMLFPVPAWVLAVFIVAGDIAAVTRIEGSGPVAFTAHLAGALFAVLYYKFNWRLSDWLPSGFSLPKFRRGPKLRVHRPSDDDDDEDSIDARVDAILKKINEQGQASLTRSERKLLEQASREYQQRRK